MARPFSSLLAIPLLAVLLMLAGCSDPEVAAYSEVTNSEFMAACTDPLTDSRLIADLCQCVYEEAEENVPFADFAAADRKLKAAELPELPSVYRELLAECVISEGGL